MTIYRAPNEYAWAALLDTLAIAYKYEALEESVSRAIRYQPDFWLPDTMAWLEIKPTSHIPTPGELRVAWQLVEATGCPVYLAAGWPQVGGLRLWVCLRDYPAEQAAEGRQALLWLALAMKCPIWAVLEASREVMRRRLEFIRLWKESPYGQKTANGQSR